MYSTALFGQISAASNCWSNHVGIIIGHNGEDFLVAESRVPLSTITTLSRFIKRSSNQRYAIKRLDAGLTEQQKQRIVEQVPSRLRKLYHTGFKYESSRQFCSKFVFDIYKEALCIPVGEIETFEELLNSNRMQNSLSGNSGSWVLFRGSVKPSRQPVCGIIRVWC